MKKSFFKYGVMAAMMLVAGFSFTACGDDEDDSTPDVITPDGGEDGDDAEEASPIASVSVVYSIKTADIADVLAVADDVYVRYVGEDNQIHQEPFSGEWEKAVQIPVIEGGGTMACQVIGVAKDSTSLAAISDKISLNFTVTATHKLTYANGNTSESFTFAKNDNQTYNLPDNFDYMLKVFNNDEERYGGINLAAYADNVADDSVTSLSFWKANKFVPGE